MRPFTLSVIIVLAAVPGAFADGSPLSTDAVKQIKWAWSKAPSANGRVTILEKTAAGGPFHLTEKNGLASSWVTSIAQLADGAIVLGTDHGLSIWRGSQVATYTGPEYSSIQQQSVPANSALPANEIHDVLVASGGALWIATGSGVCRILKDRWEILNAEAPAFELSAAVNDVESVYECRSGKIVLGSRMAGITIIDPAGSIRTIYHNDDMNNWVTAIAEDRKGNLWLGIRGLGVVRYDWETLVLFTEKEAWIPENNIRSLCVDASDTVWVGTHTGLGARFADGTTKVFTQADALPHDTVWELSQQPDGAVWAFTVKGFAVFHGKKWGYPVFEGPITEGLSCPVFRARDGALWVGGAAGAWRNPQVNMQHQNPSVTGVAALKKRIEREFPDVELPATLAAMDRDGRAWIYAHNKLLCYDGKNWKDLSKKLKGHEVSFVKSDSRGRVWIGTSGAGLLGYAGSKAYHFNDDPNHRKSVIYDMGETSKGMLYCGTQDGVYSLDGETWIHVIKEFYQAHPILVDRQDRLWFADVNYGLFLYDGKATKRISDDPRLKGRCVVELALTDDGDVRVRTMKQTRKGTEKKTFVCDGLTCREVPHGDE